MPRDPDAIHISLGARARLGQRYAAVVARHVERAVDRRDRDADGAHDVFAVLADVPSPCPVDGLARAPPAEHDLVRKARRRRGGRRHRRRAVGVEGHPDDLVARRWVSVPRAVERNESPTPPPLGEGTSRAVEERDRERGGVRLEDAERTGRVRFAPGVVARAARQSGEWVLARGVGVEHRPRRHDRAAAHHPHRGEAIGEAEGGPRLEEHEGVAWVVGVDVDALVPQIVRSADHAIELARGVARKAGDVARAADEHLSVAPLERAAGCELRELEALDHRALGVVRGGHRIHRVVA